MTISKAIIDQLYPKAKPALAQALDQQSQTVLGAFGLLDNANRLYFFLAQIGHESAGLSVTEENLNYRADRLCAVWPKRFPTLDAAAPYANNPQALANKVYGGRMGNVDANDGWTYRGRGLIQITGRDNYRLVAGYAQLDLENDPDLAADPNHALTVACGYWRMNKLNDYCDADDFIGLSEKINNGSTGLDDRQAWLAKVRQVMESAPSVADVQQALLERGYTELGTADGKMGPRTQAAITRFRADNSLPPGGIAPDLLSALNL